MDLKGNDKMDIDAFLKKLSKCESAIDKHANIAYNKV